MLSWIARNCLGILPFDRHALRHGEDPLAGCVEALDRGEILILYPEGSRGEPEQSQRFRKGVYHLALRRPEVPIIPVYLRGTGKVLPKGAALPVPLRCDVVVGPALPDRPSGAEDFIDALERAVLDLAPVA